MVVNLPNAQGRMILNPHSGFIRDFVLKRDGYQCQHCAATSGLDVHHKIPISRVPEMEWDAENMLTLCRSCHGKEHGRIIHLPVGRPKSPLTPAPKPAILDPEVSK